MHSLKYAGAFLLSVALLAGCAGGVHSTMLPAMSPQQAPGSAPFAPQTRGRESLSVTVTIPTSPRRRGMHADYVSRSTQSIGFAYTSLPSKTKHAEQFANVTASSPDCKRGAKGTICTLSFNATPGKIAYTVDTFDGLHGRGHNLSSAQARMTVAAGKANHFSITLDGVPASFKMKPAQTTVMQSFPQNIALTISAYDADGNLIVNSPAFWNSAAGGAFKTVRIVISNSGEGSSEFTLQQNGKTLPTVSGHASTYKLTVPFTNVTINYTGNGLSEAAFTLKPPAGTGDQVNIKVSPRTAVTPKNLYVAADGDPGALYAFTLPFHTGESALKLLPSVSGQVAGLATDGFGTVAVVSDSAINLYHGTPGSANAPFVSYAYPSGFSSTGGGNNAAFDPSGNLYVTGNGSTSAVIRFAAPFTAGEQPSLLKVCYWCESISIDPSSGTMYVGEGGDAHQTCGYGSADDIVETVAPPYTDGSQKSTVVSCSSSGASQVQDVHIVSAADAGDTLDAGLWVALQQGYIYNPSGGADVTEAGQYCRDGFGNAGIVFNFAVYENTTYFSNSVGPSNGVVCAISPATAPTPAPGQSDQRVLNAAAMPSGVYPSILMPGP